MTDSRFRFASGNFIYIFLDDGIAVVNVLPKALLLLLVAPLFIALTSVAGYQITQNLVLLYLGGVSIIFALTTVLEASGHSILQKSQETSFRRGTAWKFYASSNDSMEKNKAV